MENVINIIEKLGADCALKVNAAEAVTQHSELTTELKQAILNGDVENIELMLNVRNKIVCMVFPVEEPKDEPEQPDEDEQPNEVKIASVV